MILTLLANEWRGLLRDGRGVMVLVLGALLAVVSSWTASSTDKRERLGQAEATDSARDAWLEKEADNPHSRAHYGDFVYRPSGPLAGLDSGLQMVTGRSVFVEAHRQNAAVHIPQREASALLRFDRLEPSTVLHLLVPLIVILVGFGSFASERESGRLRLLRVQGARPLQLLLAKSLSLWAVGALLLLLVSASHLALADGFDPGRTAVHLLLHLAGLWVVAALVACISSTTRRSGTAAAVLLSLWVCGVIVLPRLAAVTAEAVLPLPARDAFDAAMREDREQGMDGHNPRDERRQALEQEILAEHGVESPEELPFNMRGLLFMADEDYGDRVWDEHFGELEEHMLRQSRVAAGFSLCNPTQALDRLSMAIAGTDLRSNLAFQRQAEEYRRSLIHALNEEYAYGGSKTGERGWTATPEFYASMEPFHFEVPAMTGVVDEHWIELGALAAWFLGVSGFLVVRARQLEKGANL